MRLRTTKTLCWACLLAAALIGAQACGAPELSAQQEPGIRVSEAKPVDGTASTRASTGAAPRPNGRAVGADAGPADWATVKQEDIWTLKTSGHVVSAPVSALTSNGATTDTVGRIVVLPWGSDSQVRGQAPPDCEPRVAFEIDPAVRTYLPTEEIRWGGIQGSETWRVSFRERRGTLYLGERTNQGEPVLDAFVRRVAASETVAIRLLVDARYLIFEWGLDGAALRQALREEFSCSEFQL